MCRGCGWILTGTGPGAAVEAKTSGMAIASMVLGILSIFASILTALPGIVLGIISLIKISGSNGQLKGKGMAITGIVTSFVLPLLLFVAILMPALTRARYMGQRVMCINNLKQLGLATMTYTEVNDDKFPTPDKWCDLLERYTRDDRLYVCPTAKQEKCSYSINKNLPKIRSQIRKPGEMILLFESKPGWNQAGGPELLTTKNHYGEGCCVVFCDGHAEFIRAKDINNLRWETGP